MKHNAISAIIGAVRITAVAAVGLATVTALAACGTASPSRHQPTGAKNSQYRYYLSMMGRYRGGSMMGGGPGGWMMGPGGYRWMTGARGVPGWMRGAHFPGYMMSSGADPGKIMGRFWANSPGPRVSPALAARLGRQLPAGARVNRAANTITFTTSSVRFAGPGEPGRRP